MEELKSILDSVKNFFDWRKKRGMIILYDYRLNDVNGRIGVK